MDGPEIILNLWYVYDDLGMIYSLRGRCYIGSGSDEEKLAFLRRLAGSDYLIAQPFPVPERLHTRLVTEEGTRKLPIVDKGAVEVMGGPGVLFEEVYVEMEKQLPAQTQLSIGSDPLICITPLLGSDDGTLIPITSPSVRFRRRRNPKAGDSNPVTSVLQQTPFAAEPDPAVIELYRREEMLELYPSDWQMALQIFNEMGWIPERPLEAYAAPLAFVKNYEGEAMHHAGEALLAVVDDEPLVSASVQMDLGVFYRISEFVAGGSFIVGRKGAYAEARANRDF